MGKDKMCKIKLLIQDDRPTKLKLFVKKHKIVLGDMVLKKDRNLLHYCCRNGSGIMYKYLLNAGVDPYCPDREGNLPLHLSLKRALKSADSQNVYTDLILPQLEHFPDLLDLANKTGDSCRQLLDMLVEKNRQEMDCSEKRADEDQTETEWRNKLGHELEEECFENHQGFGDDGVYAETYDDWADRISKDYHRKRQFQNSIPSKKKSRHKSNLNDSKVKDAKPSITPDLESIRKGLRKKYDEHQKQARELFLKKKRSQYEKKFQDLLTFSSSDQLGYDDIPWPCTGNTASVMDALFSDFSSRQSDSYKKYLREQQKRWHPDKFLQKLGSRITDKDRERILERVKEISQALNKLSER